MLASFLGEASVLVTKDEHIIIQFPNDFARSMCDTPRAKELICRSCTAEMKHEVKEQDLLLEVVDGATQSLDTPIDDLLKSVEQQSSFTKKEQE